MAAMVTLVLPIDAEAPTPRALAPGAASFEGRRVGVVDNGLWRSMAVLVGRLEHEVRGRGAAGVVTTPFDHLDPGFAQQQAALVPFSAGLAGAVAGLGN
jgi:hypothetical protein